MKCLAGAAVAVVLGWFASNGHAQDDTGWTTIVRPVSYTSDASPFQLAQTPADVPPSLGPPATTQDLSVLPIPGSLQPIPAVAPSFSSAAPSRCGAAPPAVVSSYLANPAADQRISVSPIVVQRMYRAPVVPPYSTYRPVVATTAAYPSAYPAAYPAAYPSGYVFGAGIIGQPKLYIPGQPIRNALRYLTP